ncbi:hypothetical protein THMIRHAS_21160 [Thiosulfatimonas sediminis]|uniref:Flagellar motor switch protein FliG C-terminal domain-containing protein n=1 Tax=Thiosulfatimonas sediminis TaxID=2675054 RepID=A0A6F8PX68_9GAMM|nr:FliG C-terminal domain-containing protein [Thiosulfatimonas sediminis]BBP46743.1 hypothetical protein THMIRHAS_21160 [Thiosulfatimonas sediminis]
MQVGIKKIHENEWLVQIGFAALKIDRFSLALLQITLEHLLALDHGQPHSTLQSYIKLGMRMKKLSQQHLQALLRELDSNDLVMLLLLAKDESFTNIVLENSGAIITKQLIRDLQEASLPSEDLAKQAIRRIVEKTFALQAQGQIEFISAETQYI